MSEPKLSRLSAVALILLTLYVAACDDDDPALRVSLSAQPQSISVTGTSTISAVVTNSVGSPVSGIAITWGTNFASIGGLGGSTNANGIATAVLSGNGQTGVATISARLNTGERAELQVPIN